YRGQVRSLASHIGHSPHQAVREFALHSETPLLYIRPYRFARNRGYVNRIGARSEWTGNVGVPDAADTRIGGDSAASRGRQLRHREIERSATDQRAGVGLASRAMLKKYAVAAANRSAAISARIEGKSYSRRGIEAVCLHAGRGDTGSEGSAFNQSIDEERADIAGSGWNRNYFALVFQTPVLGKL